MSRILIVEDDADLSMLISFKLRQAGHDVRVEHDGEGGLAAVRAELPDLVVLDWMMPKLTGIEVCVAMRADAASARIPVILLTAKAQEVDVQRGYAAGADDYVLKPFSPRDLASRVEALLQRDRRR